MLLFLSVNAQSNFEGLVHDMDKGEAIPNVQVFHHDSKAIRTTDGDGRFNFDNIKAGTSTFTFYHEGYLTLSDTIDIDRAKVYHIKLKTLSVDLAGVNVFGEREELFAIKQLEDVVGTNIYAGKKTEVVVMDKIKANLAVNNGRQIFSQVPGLNIYEGSDGGLQLNLGGRGLDPNRTSNFNTRQNGYDISADVLGYPENYYTPPSEALSEIRIIRGASSLQYGTQFGGLIDFRIRKTPVYKKFGLISSQTIGSFGLFNSFNSFGLNKGKFSINAFYNYKKGNGYRSNSDFLSNNVFGSLSYRFNNNTSINFELTYFAYLAKQAGGLTDEQFEDNPRLSTRSRNWFEINWKLYSIDLQHRFGPNSRISLNLFGLSASRKSIGFRGNPTDLNSNPITRIDEENGEGQYLNARDLIIGDFQNYGAEIRSINQFEAFEKKTILLLGAKYYKSDNSSMQGPGSRGSDADFELYSTTFPDYANQSNFKFPNENIALFSEYIIYLSSKLSITPGIRLEHIKTKSQGSYKQIIFDNAGNPISSNTLSDNRELSRNFALLGLGLNYKHNNALKLVANLSQNYRSVTFNDIRVVNPSFIIDPDISDERGYTGDIGIKGRVNKILSYDLTSYALVYRDRIGVILDDRANRVRKNIGNAYILGTESLISVNLGPWLLSQKEDYKANLFVNSAFTFSEYFNSQENNVVGKKVEFIPSANIKAGLELGYKKLSIAYQFSYVGKQFTDAQNSPIAPVGDKRSGLVGEIPSYQISDLTLSYNWKKFTLNAGINNLFDLAYFTRRATGYPGPGIIPSNGRSFFLTGTYKI